MLRIRPVPSASSSVRKDRKELFHHGRPGIEGKIQEETNSAPMEGRCGGCLVRGSGADRSCARRTRQAVEYVPHVCCVVRTLVVDLKEIEVPTRACRRVKPYVFSRLLPRYPQSSFRDRLTLPRITPHGELPLTCTESKGFWLFGEGTGPTSLGSPVTPPSTSPSWTITRKWPWPPPWRPC